VVPQQQAAVVKLFGAGVGNLDSYGSGTLISEEGHVLTIWNHLINTGFLTAVTSDGNRYLVDVVGTSRDFDVAVLKLRTNGQLRFPYVDMQQSVSVSPGQSVLAFSNMFRVAAGAEPVSVVHGVIAQKVPVVAGLGRWKLPIQSPVYIVDAVVNNSGAAGGLLTTTDGLPVGLIGREIQFATSGTWLNYAVPLTDLQPVVSALLSGKTVDAAIASETPPPLSDLQLTARFGITLLPVVVERTPCYVDSVVSNSPAAEAGLQRGDLIVLLDDEIVVSVTDFRQKLATHRAGRRVPLTVQRDQQLVALMLLIP
jgi:serine protease Do